VEAITLDDLVDRLGLPYVSAIKIDAEGAELDILRGANTVLRRHCPQLSIAAYHVPSEAYQITEFLMRVQFKVKLQDGYVYTV
jgi:hypothetical protein